MFGNKKKKSEEQSRARALKLSEQSELGLLAPKGGDGGNSGRGELDPPPPPSTVADGGGSNTNDARVVSTILSPYAPKPSGRVGSISADNDAWVEHYAVVEVEESGSRLASKRSKYVIRSFFQSRDTGKREWDEPPSGASDIQYATTEMRKMAEAQLQDLGPVPSKGSGEGEVEASKSKRKGSLVTPKWMRRKGAAASGKSSSVPDQGTEEARQKKAQDRKIAAKKEYDRQLQMAIANSLDDPPAGSAVFASKAQGDDDEIAMAKALSISELEVTGQGPPNQPDEEEVLRQVIERSKAETKGQSMRSPVHSHSYSSGMGLAKASFSTNSSMALLEDAKYGCGEKATSSASEAPHCLDGDKKMPAIATQSNELTILDEQQSQKENHEVNNLYVCDEYESGNGHSSAYVSNAVASSHRSSVSAVSKNSETTAAAAGAAACNPLASFDMAPSVSDSSPRKLSLTDRKWSIGSRKSSSRSSKNTAPAPASTSHSETTELV